MKRFLIDNLYFVQMTLLYLPIGWEVSKFIGILTFTAESLVCGMTLLTAEQKEVRIRQNLLYVKM